MKEKKLKTGQVRAKGNPSTKGKQAHNTMAREDDIGIKKLLESGRHDISSIPYW